MHEQKVCTRNLSQPEESPGHCHDALRILHDKSRLMWTVRLFDYDTLFHGDPRKNATMTTLAQSGGTVFESRGDCISSAGIDRLKCGRGSKCSYQRRDGKARRACLPGPATDQ